MSNQQPIRIGKQEAKHLYAVEVEQAGRIFTIEVDADSRAQANRIATEHGYTVRSVNMIG